MGTMHRLRSREASRRPGRDAVFSGLDRRAFQEIKDGDKWRHNNVVGGETWMAIVPRSGKIFETRVTWRRVAFVPLGCGLCCGQWA